MQYTYAASVQRTWIYETVLSCLWPSCRVTGDNPTHADSYDIDMEVPASTADQATASLLQNLNTSREVEQVSTASQLLSVIPCTHQLLCEQHATVNLDLCISAEGCSLAAEGCQASRNAKLSDCKSFTHFGGMCAY